MKISDNKGVTLTSLIIYIIAMLALVAVVSTISMYFHSNVLQVDDDTQNLGVFNTFNKYFLKKKKKENNRVISSFDETGSKIKFSDNVTFTFVEVEKAIYRNDRKICENIVKCTFTPKVVDEKEIVDVYMVIGNKNEFEKTMSYVVNK